MTDGFRESTQSWREVLLDLKASWPEARIRSWPSATAPLGFWAALREVFPTTRGTAVLAAQDHERAECDAKIRSGQGEGAPARHLAGRHEGRSQRRLRLLRRGLRREMGTRRSPSWSRTGTRC